MSKPHPKGFPFWGLAKCQPHLSFHPGRQNCLCLSFFPSRCIYNSFLLNPTHITSVSTKRTLNPCLLKISFHSFNCSWRFASPSATTASPPAYNSFWNMTYTNLSAYQFHHSDKQQWGQGAPMCQANIYFGLSLHPRSTQLPALRVLSINLTSPWDHHPHQCSQCHFS